MKQNDWHKILKAEPLENNVVKIEFSDNSFYNFDLKPFISEDSIFWVLKDQEQFSKVKIADDGRSLIFPNELDFCTDSLWLKAHPNSVPF